MSQCLTYPNQNIAIHSLLCTEGKPPGPPNRVGTCGGIFDGSDRGVPLIGSDADYWQDGICLLDVEDVRQAIGQELGEWPSYEYLLDYAFLLDFVHRNEGVSLGVCLVSESPGHRPDLLRMRSRVERQRWRFIVASEQLRDSHWDPVEVYVACELELLTWQHAKRTKAVMVGHRHNEAIV